MSAINLRWIGEDQFLGIDSGKHAVVVSNGQDSAGVSPTGLVLIALATCIAVTLVILLNKPVGTLRKLEIEAEGKQGSSEQPGAFTDVHLHFKLIGKNISEAGVKRAFWLAEQKYCPVAAAMHGTAQISASFHISST